MEKNNHKQSLFERIKCWFTGESKSACGGGPVKPSDKPSDESKDPKVCSNGEIRF